MLPEDEILRQNDEEQPEVPYINRSQRLDAVLSRNFALTGCLGFVVLLIVGFFYSFMMGGDVGLGQIYSGWGF